MPTFIDLSLHQGVFYYPLPQGTSGLTYPEVHETRPPPFSSLAPYSITPSIIPGEEGEGGGDGEREGEMGRGKERRREKDREREKEGRK